VYIGTFGTEFAVSLWWRGTTSQFQPPPSLLWRLSDLALPDRATTNCTPGMCPAARGMNAGISITYLGKVLADCLGGHADIMAERTGTTGLTGTLAEELAGNMRCVCGEKRGVASASTRLAHTWRGCATATATARTGLAWPACLALRPNDGASTGQTLTGGASGPVESVSSRHWIHHPIGTGGLRRLDVETAASRVVQTGRWHGFWRRKRPRMCVACVRKEAAGWGEIWAVEGRRPDSSARVRAAGLDATKGGVDRGEASATAGCLQLETGDEGSDAETRNAACQRNTSETRSSEDKTEVIPMPQEWVVIGRGAVGGKGELAVRKGGDGAGCMNKASRACGLRSEGLQDNPRPGKYPSSPGAAGTGQSDIRPYACCDKPTRDVLPGKDLQARQVTLAGSPMRRPRSSHRSSLFSWACPGSRSRVRSTSRVKTIG